MDTRLSETTRFNKQLKKGGIMSYITDGVMSQILEPMNTLSNELNFGLKIAIMALFFIAAIISLIPLANTNVLIAIAMPIAVWYVFVKIVTFLFSQQVTAEREIVTLQSINE